MHPAKRRFIKHALITLWGSLSLIATAAKKTTIYGMRLWTSDDHMRIVLDLDGETPYQTRASSGVFTVSVMHASEFFPLGQKVLDNNPFISKITSESILGSTSYHLHLKTPLKEETFLLKPYEKLSYRLVIDLRRTQAPVQEKIRRKPFLVMIDPGHGGEDPGAIGKRKTREKDVVLAIAKRVESLINAHPHMEAQLTRKGDYYVPLRRRIQKAARAKANAFVSIHADAARRSSPRGGSVYVLSSKGASSQFAKWLAKKENAADFVGGANTKDLTGLNNIILKLSQDGAKASSYKLADFFIDAMKKVGPMHKKRVQKANFAVLKAPNIPSALVETTFISNPREEQKLKNPTYQRNMAQAIFNAIKRYYDNYRKG